MYKLELTKEEFDVLSLVIGITADVMVPLLSDEEKLHMTSVVGRMLSEHVRHERGIQTLEEGHSGTTSQG